MRIEKTRITWEEYNCRLKNVLYDRGLCEVLNIDYNRINIEDVWKAKAYLNRIYTIDEGDEDGSRKI